MTFKTSNIHVKAEANKSIYFDEENDVVLFTKKHDLIKDD
jgi:hypothetical protein